VGRPIKVPRIPHPTNEQIDEYQKLYVDELQHIYDTYKDEYARDRQKELTIIR
jgi:2-acylglycerol O-acyltransferase 2